MARKTNTYALTHNWILLNPNDEETVVIQGRGAGNIRVAMAEDIADLYENKSDPDNIIEAEDGHILNGDTGMGTAFYNLSTKLFARLEGTAVSRQRGSSFLTVTAY